MNGTNPARPFAELREYARIVFVGLCLSLFVNGAAALIGTAFAIAPLTIAPFDLRGSLPVFISQSQ